MGDHADDAIANGWDAIAMRDEAAIFEPPLKLPPTEKWPINGVWRPVEEMTTEHIRNAMGYLERTRNINQGLPPVYGRMAQELERRAKEVPGE